MYDYYDDHAVKKFLKKYSTFIIFVAFWLTGGVEGGGGVGASPIQASFQNKEFYQTFSSTTHLVNFL
jgi:hypothetical protein